MLLRALSSSVTVSLLILSPAKAVNQVDLGARRKESVPFDQISVMILTGWPVTGRDARLLQAVGERASRRQEFQLDERVYGDDARRQQLGPSLAQGGLQDQEEHGPFRW